MSATFAVCRFLRARSAYDELGGEGGWTAAPTSLDAYWCLKTMEAFGPDDGLVHRHACCEGRACFSSRAAHPSAVK
ncbi:MAG TPA: hypothetical protein VLV17_03365 [Anaeromyxobacteraceae bacterium]|nr:hypothetical protein [Anaeromyxobacteraceae bacterium]